MLWRSNSEPCWKQSPNPSFFGGSQLILRADEKLGIHLEPQTTILNGCFNDDEPNLYIENGWKSPNIHRFINGWPWGSRHILRDQPGGDTFFTRRNLRGFHHFRRTSRVGIPPPPSGDDTDLRVTELPTQSHRSHGSHVIPIKTGEGYKQPNWAIPRNWIDIFLLIFRQNRGKPCYY